MKKNIVFVLPSLDAGGGEKSLINLLKTIDYDAYAVDLILFHTSGLFLQSVPKEVTLLEIGGNYKIFKLGLSASVLGFLKQFKLQLAWSRIVYALNNKLLKNTAVAEQTNWKYVARSIATVPKKYDAAIGFLEKSSNYFVADKITAEIKIGWIHTIYSSSGMSAIFDVEKFQKLNYIVAVSEECALDLKQVFPALGSKIKLIHNIVSPKLILELSQQKIAMSDFKSANLFVTVARLSHEKGIDIAVAAAKILKDNGIDFQWIIIGDGVEKESLLQKIKDYNLLQNFELLGLKENPYPYLAKATIYIQPSRYEGKSIAIDEAKILGKPLVVTNYPSAKDQINSGINGLIAETNPNAVANAVLNLLEDKQLQAKFVSNLKSEQLGTTEEIIKLYDLIDGK